MFWQISPLIPAFVPLSVLIKKLKGVAAGMSVVMCAVAIDKSV
ncbi:hypothetical protein [Serratia symbiotica]|nr:hypothetical protein [Serratia symbiotica]